MRYPKSILVKLPDDDHQSLKLLAERKRGTVTGLIRSAIAELLQREELAPLTKKSPPSGKRMGGI